MRSPNYKVYVYDLNSRFMFALPVWAVNAQKAYKKARDELSRQKKEPDNFTLVAREITA
jgi:membrane-anchored glycerophosphoryl diester phosphodiesterase (GDPDase)